MKLTDCTGQWHPYKANGNKTESM